MHSYSKLRLWLSSCKRGFGNPQHRGDFRHRLFAAIVTLDKLAIAADKLFHALDKHVETQVHVGGGIGQLPANRLGHRAIQHHVIAPSVSQVRKHLAIARRRTPSG